VSANSAPRRLHSLHKKACETLATFTYLNVISSFRLARNKVTCCCPESMQRDNPWEVAAPPLNPEVIFTLVFALNTTESDAGVHDSIAEHQQTSKTRRIDFLAVPLLFSIYHSSAPMSQCHISPNHSRQRVPRSHISCSSHKVDEIQLLN
jgi:hypothetical protein